MEIGPKRPWEDLKDPEKNLREKLARDCDKNLRAEKNGGVRGL